jgi:NAD(P)-dependent dehydrogenase (short-subunit alcohol dehydrogenase family)
MRNGTFVVTGVTSGVGLALAHALAHTAERLVIVGRSGGGLEGPCLSRPLRRSRARRGASSIRRRRCQSTFRSTSRAPSCRGRSSSWVSDGAHHRAPTDRLSASFEDGSCLDQIARCEALREGRIDTTKVLEPRALLCPTIELGQGQRSPQLERSRALLSRDLECP